MSTFLQLVQQLYRELGLSGTVPTTVVFQTNIRRRAVDWIAEADYETQSKWNDWNFMWAQWSTGTVTGTANYAAPTSPAVGRYDVESFYIDRISDDFQHLSVIPYKDWRRDYRNGVKTNGLPEMFTILPDKSVTLEPPPDSSSYTLTADYWKKPTKMTVDADTSEVPVEFERIIIARAKVMYAEHFKDLEMLQMAGAEYATLLKQLEAAELPDRQDRVSQATELVIQVQ